MSIHISNIGQRDRRKKGNNNKPKIYLLVEIFLLALVVFLISLLKIKFITVLSALGALYLLMMSCLPRYSRVKKRQ